MMPFPPPVHPYMPLVVAHIAAGCVGIGSLTWRRLPF